MQETANYIQVMIDSLKKKSIILDRILEKNEAQTECIKNKEYEDINWNAFNVLMAEKETAIDQINEIDDGFESVYERIRDDLMANKASYKSEIQDLKDLISELTDKGIKIQAGEDRNRQMIDNIFSKSRKTVKQQRNSLKVATSYYQTMRNTVVSAAEDSILDSKK